MIDGTDLPGTMFRNAGVPIHAVHVGVQVRAEPTGLVRGDATSARWTVDIRVTERDGSLDFAGPAVHGKRGERFVYLTWGDLGPDGSFAMFRRLKVMLGGIDPAVVRAAEASGTPVTVRIPLTDTYGGPRCGRLGSPEVQTGAE